MAEGSVTVTGLKELKASVDKLPDTVTAALRSVAWRTSRSVMDKAKQLVPVDTGYTRDHIHVVEFPDEKLFVVNAGTDAPRVSIALHRSKRSGRTHTQRVTQNNLPLWLERGTRFMRARPFMRPAADASEDQYKREMVATAEQTVQQAVK